MRRSVGRGGGSRSGKEKERKREVVEKKTNVRSVGADKGKRKKVRNNRKRGVEFFLKTIFFSLSPKLPLLFSAVFSLFPSPNL